MMLKDEYLYSLSRGRDLFCHRLEIMENSVVADLWGTAFVVPYSFDAI